MLAGDPSTRPRSHIQQIRQGVQDHVIQNASCGLVPTPDSLSTSGARTTSPRMPPKDPCGQTLSFLAADLANGTRTMLRPLLCCASSFPSPAPAILLMSSHAVPRPKRASSIPRSAAQSVSARAQGRGSNCHPTSRSRALSCAPASATADFPRPEQLAAGESQSSQDPGAGRTAGVTVHSGVPGGSNGGPCSPSPNSGVRLTQSLRTPGQRGLWFSPYFQRDLIQKGVNCND